MFRGQSLRVELHGAGIAELCFDRQNESINKFDARTVAALNSDVRIEEHNCRISAENARDLIAGYDIVADGSDNFATRFLVNDACYFAERTLVSAAVTEFDGQLATFKAFEREGKFPCYRCLFPEAPPPGSVPSCSETGILGAAAGVMGTLQALEVMKEIIGIGEGLAGQLLIYDALATRFADADQQPGRHRDAKFAGSPQGLEPSRRRLVRGTEMGAASLAQPFRCALEHQAHGRAHAP